MKTRETKAALVPYTLNPSPAHIEFFRTLIGTRFPLEKNHGK